MKSTSLIEVQGLTKRFRGGTLAVNHLSLEIPYGKVIGLIGPNGAGKTTFMSLLAGLLRPTSGGLVWNTDLSSRKVLFAPQNPVFPRKAKVLDCVRLYASLDGFTGTTLDEEARRVLSSVALWEERSKYAEQLSEGMKKRLSVAQALIGAAPLVLLDEHTAMLDPENAVRIRHIIRAKSPAQTILVSSHNLAEVEEYCETVIILQNGQLVEAEEKANERDGTTSIQIAASNPLPEQWIQELNSWDSILEVDWTSGTRQARIVTTRSQAPVLLVEVTQSAQASGVEIQGIQQGESLEERFLKATR